jgi:putative ABC transport system permease protein
MEALRHDILYALRVLRKDRTYAVAVILTLAVCLGANTAIFTVVRSVLLRPLPYPEPDRLVSSYDSFPEAGVALRSYTERALARVRALPGVEAAGITSYLPFSWDGSSSVIIPEGYAAKPGESILSPNQLYVSAGYLDALKVPVRRGRLFSDSDTAGAPRVVIVDENLAARFWPDRDPIGRRVYIPSKPEDVSGPGPGVTWLQVVGVVGAVKLRAMEEGENARAGAYYQPYTPALTRGIAWAIRSRGDVVSTRASVERALAEIDPEVALTDVFAMSERIE